MAVYSPNWATNYVQNINVKTAVYTHVNGDRPSHIETAKIKKLYSYITAHRRTSMCSSIVK